MTDPRDALLLKALEDLYWWAEEHGCCRGVSSEVEQAIYAHLTAAGVPVETYAEWVARKQREHDEEMASLRRETDRAVAARAKGGAWWPSR